MAIQIGNYNFDGPHPNTAALFERSGVYVILGRTGQTSWAVVDIGESESVRNRVENHDRRQCWQARGYQTLAVAALYVAELQRMVVEQNLRAHFNPPCGKR